MKTPTHLRVHFSFEPVSNGSAAFVMDVVCGIVRDQLQRARTPVANLFHSPIDRDGHNGCQVTIDIEQSASVQAAVQSLAIFLKSQSFVRGVRLASFPIDVI